jgi:hypothetical protein
LESVCLPTARFLKDAGALFRYHPILKVMFRHYECGYYTNVLYDADMRSRGGRRRVPGPLFPYLADVGRPCVIRGAEARFEVGADPYVGVDAVKVVSRAAVNYGRHEAGLPPYHWKPLGDFLTEIREGFDDDDD